MRLHVYFTPLGVTNHAIAGIPVLVIDVLRATTSIVAALAHGARAVIPAADPDEALKLAHSLESDTALLAGERGSERIEGFALGNSPLEMVGDAVTDKTLVMSTTNGTPAVLAADQGAPVLLGSITNFSAVVARVKEEFDRSGELVILCAGREGMFALEDAYVAGRVADELLSEQVRRSVPVNDAALAALQLARYYGTRWRRAVSDSAAARRLEQLGFGKDIDAATAVDAHSVVPLYSDRLISLQEAD